MATAIQGLTLSLNDALRILTDHKGNALEFEQQKDGTYSSKEVEGDNYTYAYSLTPQTTIVTVSIAKIPKEDKKSKAAEKKAEEDAKTIAENAPDNKTKKEAQQYASQFKR